MSGYFTDDSIIRRVHSERVVALAGPRALLMQAAHPLAVSGLLAHSTALEAPYERLARTAEVMDTIVFGTRREADRVARRVRGMHRRVSGRLAAASGPYPAGTAYRADDPALLMWILYTLVDSTGVVYRRYVGELEEDALWHDYRVIGRLFGLRAGDMPATAADLRRYGDEMIRGDTLRVSPWARERARAIVLEPPVRLLARPLVEAVNFVTIALLPDPIRRQYRFSPLAPAALRETLVAAQAEYVKRAVIPLLPARLRYVPRPLAA